MAELPSHQSDSEDEDETGALGTLALDDLVDGPHNSGGADTLTSPDAHVPSPSFLNGPKLAHFPNSPRKQNTCQIHCFALPSSTGLRASRRSWGRESRGSLSEEGFPGD